MRVLLQFLIPGVEHAEEADLGAQMAGIARDFQQGFGAGAEQQIVDNLLVLQSQRGQTTRKGEDHVHVAGGQEFAGGAPPASGRGPGPDTWDSADFGT